MKACFVFQRRFTPVAHEMAQTLARKHGFTEFCGYVYLRHNLNFLRTQNDVTYGTLLLDEDLHRASFAEPVDWAYLEEIEKEYGLPSLWPYLNADRIIRLGQAVREYPYQTPPYTHEEMARMLQVTARSIINFLDTEKPDVLYLPVVSSLGNMLLYVIAKKKGMRVLVGADTRIERGYGLSEDYRTFTFVDQRFEQLRAGASSPKEEAARAYLKSYRAAPRTYLYLMEEYKSSGKRSAAWAWFAPAPLWRSLRWFIAKAGISLRRRTHDYTDEPLWGFFLDRVRRKARLLRGFSDLYDTPCEGEDFAYFPLHVEPEMTLLVLAPFFTDQLNLVKQVAQSLPLHFKLYVKEHPAMMGYRTRAYYKELKKIPNVRLIHPNHSSHVLTQGSKLLVTITSTAGWEAVLLQKPVITFGDVYYNTLSTVKKCVQIDTLPSLIKERLEHFQPDEKELEQFVAALLEESVEIGHDELWQRGATGAQRQKKIDLLCDLLVRKAGLMSV